MSQKIKSSQKEISNHKGPSFFKKHYIIAYFILILIPVLFFFLLELSLRYFKYGRSYEQWVESPNGQWVGKGGKFLIINPDIAYKYFHVLKTIPQSTHVAFDKEKKQINHNEEAIKKLLKISNDLLTDSEINNAEIQRMADTLESLEKEVHKLRIRVDNHSKELLKNSK